MANQTNLKVKEFRLYQAQADLYQANTDQVKDIIGTGGEQAGKTSLGVLWLRKQVERYWNEQPYNYIVGANTYKVLKQSTKETFDKVFTAYLGSYNEKDDYFQLRRDGHPWGKIYFRSQGMDRKSAGDSFIGIPNCKAGFGDEIAKWQRQFYIRFKGRLGRLNGALFGCGTPYSLNFIKKEIIDRYNAGDPSVMYRRLSCLDNPSYDKESIERLRDKLTQREFNKLILGIVEKAEGMIHADWDDGNWIEPFQLPLDTKYYLGVDWGWDHPFSVVVVGMTPESEIYLVSMFKKSGLSTSQQIDHIRSKATTYKAQMCFCGHDRPDMIAELNKGGVPSVNYFAFDANLREVIAGDQKLSEIIKEKRFKAFKGIDQWEEFEEEIQTYIWDKDPELEIIGKEKALNGGAFDLLAATRYVTCGIVGFIRREKLKIVVPFGVSEHVDRGIKRSGKKHWSAY